MQMIAQGLRGLLGRGFLRVEDATTLTSPLKRKEQHDENDEGLAASSGHLLPDDQLGPAVAAKAAKPKLSKRALRMAGAGAPAPLKERQQQDLRSPQVAAKASAPVVDAADTRPAKRPKLKAQDLASSGSQHAVQPQAASKQAITSASAGSEPATTAPAVPKAGPVRSFETVGKAVKAAGSTGAKATLLSSAARKAALKAAAGTAASDATKVAAADATKAVIQPKLKKEQPTAASAGPPAAVSKASAATAATKASVSRPSQPSPAPATAAPSSKPAPPSSPATAVKAEGKPKPSDEKAKEKRKKKKAKRQRKEQEAQAEGDLSLQTPCKTPGKQAFDHVLALQALEAAGQQPQQASVLERSWLHLAASVAAEVAEADVQAQAAPSTGVSSQTAQQLLVRWVAGAKPTVRGFTMPAPSILAQRLSCSTAAPAAAGSEDQARDPPAADEVHVTSSALEQAGTRDQGLSQQAVPLLDRAEAGTVTATSQAAEARVQAGVEASRAGRRKQQQPRRCIGIGGQSLPELAGLALHAGLQPAAHALLLAIAPCQASGSELQLQQLHPCSSSDGLLHAHSGSVTQPCLPGGAGAAAAEPGRRTRGKPPKCPKPGEQPAAGGPTTRGAAASTQSTLPAGAATAHQAQAPLGQGVVRRSPEEEEALKEQDPEWQLDRKVTFIWKPVQKYRLIHEFYAPGEVKIKKKRKPKGQGAQKDAGPASEDGDV